MVNTVTLLASVLAASVVSALPLEKRIAQTIADSTAKWVAACVRFPIAIVSIITYV
jgi:hypothetical protein